MPSKQEVPPVKTSQDLLEAPTFWQAGFENLSQLPQGVAGGDGITISNPSVVVATDKDGVPITLPDGTPLYIGQ